MSSATWPDVLARLSSGDHLDEASADWAMAEIMAGNADPAQLAAFAVLLRSKGETAVEIGAIAGRMLAETTRLDLADLGVAVDIVGTGGDGSNSVNISTMAAIVVAATGVPVIKHGNRSASSNVGFGGSARVAGRGLGGDGGAGRGVGARDRDRVRVRADVPSGYAPCGSGAGGAGDSDGVQPVGAVDESGPAGGGSDRLRGSGEGAFDGAGVRGPRCVGVRGAR